MSKLDLTAQIAALPKALAFLRSEAASHGLSESSIYQMEIALEEALVNIMLYAYPSPMADAPVSIEVLADAEFCRLIITDEGIPFNPVEHVPEVAVDGDAEERDIGGLGIFFIYKYTDCVEYVRLGNQNQLTLSKRRG